MAAPDEPTPGGTESLVSDLLESPQLATAVETEAFRVFLDHVPIAILISRVILGDQRIVYANQAAEALTSQTFKEVAANGLSALASFTLEDAPHLTLPDALTTGEDFLGTFKRELPELRLVEAYSGLIENEDAGKTYRILALIDVTERERAQRDEFAKRLRDKDLLLKELQHRVKNNLQLITALIRLDARTKRNADTTSLDMLASRIESLQLLYQDLTADGLGQSIDLGHYLSQIASAVMRTYAVGGDSARPQGRPRAHVGQRGHARRTARQRVADQRVQACLSRTGKWHHHAALPARRQQLPRDRRGRRRRFARGGDLAGTGQAWGPHPAIASGERQNGIHGGKQRKQGYAGHHHVQLRGQASNGELAVARLVTLSTAISATARAT